MTSIKTRLTTGEVGGDSKGVVVQASLTVDNDHIVLRIPRKLTLDQFRESEKALFACVQAMPPAGCDFLVSNAENGKTYRIPVERKLNLNVFINWMKHQIVAAVPAAAEVKAK